MGRLAPKKSGNFRETRQGRRPPAMNSTIINPVRGNVIHLRLIGDESDPKVPLRNLPMRMDPAG